MHLPTIHATPSDRPRFDFLQAHNFLSEYKSEIDKARVRYNLGISDSLSLNWGNIKGTIEDQADLMSLITQVKSGIDIAILPYAIKIKYNEDSIAEINRTLVLLTNSINSTANYVDTQILTVADDISELKADVAQNATAIRLILATGQGLGYDDSELRAKITSLDTLLSSVRSDTETLKSLMAYLDNRTTSNTAKIEDLLTNLAETNVQVGINKATLTNYGNSLQSLTANVSSYLNRLTILEDTTSTMTNNISSNKYDIDATKTRLTTLEAKVANDEVVISGLNINLDNLSTLVLRLISKIDDMDVRLQSVESKVGSTTITKISCPSYESSALTGLTGASASIVVMASYSNGAQTDITSRVSCTSSNPNVATYSNGTVTFINAGSSILTFTYNSLQCTVNVQVSMSQQTIKQYIGYAVEYTDIIKGSGYNTIKGTWTLLNTPDYVPSTYDDDYALWIVTNETLAHVINIGEYQIGDSEDSIKLNYTYTSGDTVYTIYKIETGMSNLTLTIS